MEYLVGVALALGVGVATSVARFDRDRALYPAILLVVASYYDLFAVMGGGAALGLEAGVTFAFALAAVIGFRTNLWIVVAALAGHGLFDLVHGRLIANAGVPAWWPMFCLSYDIAAGAYLAWRLLSRRIEATSISSFGTAAAPDYKRTEQGSMGAVGSISSDRQRHQRDWVSGPGGATLTEDRH